MSPWAAPIVLVLKKTGDTCLCVDFRKLNAITKKDYFPLPRIDDVLYLLEDRTRRRVQRENSLHCGQ
jgi:hypothetical protein